jgi:hypothetical protein
MISSKSKIIDHEFSDCMEAAKELSEKFDDREWFRGAFAGIHEETHVIYLHYFNFCPEKHRLYIFKGFPVLMRVKLPPSDLKGEELCRQERKVVRK